MHATAHKGGARTSKGRDTGARHARDRLTGDATGQTEPASVIGATLDDALNRIAQLETRYAAIQRENVSLLQALARYAEPANQPAPANASIGAETFRTAAAQATTDSPSVDQLREAEEAATLLRQQLEQLEEELERELLKRIEVSARAEKTETALRTLTQHNADAVAWRAAELTHGGARLRLRLEDAILGGRELATVTVDAGRNERGGATLTVCADGLRHDRLLVDAVGGIWRTNGQALFLDRQERRILRAAAVALERELAARKRTVAAPWIAALSGLRKGLDTTCEGWRAGRAVLRSVKVNPDYEHLWFELQDAAYGESVWPVFQFRLGASNVRKGSFSKQPKLEFPLQESAPPQLENWFDESEDEHGPKLELRFDLRRGAFDTGVWGDLSPLDQQVLMGLLTDLPVWIADLYRAHPAAHRPASDWIELTHEMAELLHAREHAGSGPALS